MDNQTIFETITDNNADHRLRATAIRIFFENNQDLFPQENPQYAKQSAAIKSDEDTNIRFTWGKCFPMAQFAFYALGGYSQDRWILKCSRGNQLDILGHNIATSHWFLEDTALGHIIDPSANQFFGINIFNEEYSNNEFNVYQNIISNGRRANFGFPYYKVNGRKIDFGCTVPSKQVLRFYEAFRKQCGILPGLEPFFIVATSNI